MQPRTRYASWFGLALITLCAFGLRLYLLDAQSLWYDEGVTAEVAQRGIAELTRWTAGDIQPPLYYYVVAFWGRMGGWSEWSLRFPSVFFGALTVPLLAAVTVALTRRRLAGLVAASLAAFHPLLLYYSQEARMYTMLTALGVLLAYLVIRGELAGRRRRLLWLAYVLVAAAAVYTHYFAFFLLLALAIAYLMDQLFLLPHSITAARPAGADADLADTVARRPLTGYILANVAVLGLYLPWISALLNRLAVDASYWDGQLKIDEAIRHVAISFTSGETVLEEFATQLLWPYGALTLLALGVLLWRGNSQPRTLVYTLLWLAIPISAVLLLASITPKFNARYVMVALPGLLILWSAGVTSLVRLRAWALPQIMATPFLRFSSLFALLLIGLLHTGLFYANYNWFYDPAFTKSEWRALSRYVRTQVQQENPGSRAATASTTQAATQTNPAEEDLIILVSGHAWPVWNYYAPDLDPLRLPELEILDVNAVLDFAGSASPLHQALQEHDSVWLVQWQNRIVDPMNIVPLQLELAGEEQALDVEFWQIDLSHYTNLQADKILVEPTSIGPDSINFGNQVYLVDHQVAPNGDLLLFWKLHPDHTEPLPDLYLAGQTFTSEGQPFQQVRDRRLAGYEFPTFRWEADQINLGRIPAADWVGPGALPNRYRLRLGVYDSNGDLTGLDVLGDAGQPIGKHVTIDPELPVATTGPDTMDPVTFAQVIPDLFLEIRLNDERAEPGQAFSAELHWYAEEVPPADYDLLLRWRQRSSGEVLAEETQRLTPRLPTSAWPDDELLRTVLQLRPPLNLPADDYWLEVGLTAPAGSAVRVPFRVLGSSRLFRPPPFNTPVDVVFANELHLLGVIEPLQIRPRAGEQVALTLVWQAFRSMPADYTATVQWLGPDATPVAQSDIPLPGGSSNWLEGQVELQTFIVNAPEEPGTYRLVAAVYNANATELPRLLTEDGRDLIELGEVTVEP